MRKINLSAARDRSRSLSSSNLRGKHPHQTEIILWSTMKCLVWGLPRMTSPQNGGRGVRKFIKFADKQYWFWKQRGAKGVKQSKNYVDVIYGSHQTTYEVTETFSREAIGELSKTVFVLEVRNFRSLQAQKNQKGARHRLRHSRSLWKDHRLAMHWSMEIKYNIFLYNYMISGIQKSTSQQNIMS